MALYRATLKAENGDVIARAIVDQPDYVSHPKGGAILAKVKREAKQKTGLDKTRGTWHDFGDRFVFIISGSRNTLTIN